MTQPNQTYTRIVAILDDETGEWASLCLDHDIASQGATAEEAAQNCLEALRAVQQVVAEDPNLELQGPPTDDEVVEFIRYGRVVNGNSNLYYLINYGGGENG